MNTLIDRPPRIGSLCSGYGGLDMAIEAVIPGARPAWFCEYDGAPSRILSHHWPDVPNHIDLTAVDWTTVEPVEIVSAGYPCQPFSAAGQRKGTTDERHLWPHIREAIRVLRPRYVVLENVAGHRSLGFDRVLGDMAEDGMHVRWTSVRASDVGAPHHRERLFILATPADTAGIRPGEHVESFVEGVPATTRGGGEDATSDTGSAAVGEHPGGASSEEAGPDSSDGLGDCGGERTNGFGRSGSAHTKRIRCDRRRTAPEQTSGPQSSVDRLRPVDWGQYGPAVRRWERLTRPAPAPTEPNTKGKPRLNAEFAEWMMGLPHGHVTGVGLPRTAQLKAIGNGVCPQQAAAALGQLLALKAVTA